MKPSLIYTAALVLAATNLSAKEFLLQKAIDDASSGDTIIIPSGVYTQPVTIDKSITLEGDRAVLKIESNQPAIRVETTKPVVLKNLEVQYRTNTKPQRDEQPYAIYASDGDLMIESCSFKASGTSEQSPCAVSATDGSTLHIKESRFEGFNYTIQFWNESEGSVEDCLIIKPGHCGITVGNGSSANLNRNIVTDSRYHGIRCTGGEIHADSNLIIANKNRGFYIGNKSATGTLSNNLIVGNATGIDVFAYSKMDIINNVILHSTYTGLALRDTAKVDIENNIIVENERGIVGFPADQGETPSIKLSRENIAYGNATQSEGIKLPSSLIGLNPQFKDPDAGLFATGTNKAKGMGLTNPIEMQALWKKYQDSNVQGAASTRKVKPQPSAQTNSDKNAETQRIKARERMREDRNIYSQDELKEIETLYQVANKNWQTEEGKESLKRLTLKYASANRVGCAMLYLGQMSTGDDQIEYLRRAIDDFSDCFYGDGAQVGGFARYVLLHRYQQDGENEKAQKLIDEIRTNYPDAIDHRGNRITSLLPAQ